MYNHTPHTHTNVRTHSHTNTCTYSFHQAEQKRPEISTPVDFEHTVHVGFDLDTGEFTVSQTTKFSRSLASLPIGILLHSLKARSTCDMSFLAQFPLVVVQGNMPVGFIYHPLMCHSMSLPSSLHVHSNVSILIWVGRDPSAVIFLLVRFFFFFGPTIWFWRTQFADF